MDNQWNIMERPGILKKCCQLEAVVQKLFQSPRAMVNGLIRMVSLDGIWYYHRETDVFIPLIQKYLEESYSAGTKPEKGYIRMKSVNLAWDYADDTEAEKILPGLAELNLPTESGNCSLSEVCGSGIVLLRDGKVYDGKSGKIRLPQNNEVGKVLQICHVEDTNKRRESKSWYYDIYIWAKTGIIPAVLCNIKDCWNTILYLRDNFKDIDFTEFLLQEVEREKVEKPAANMEPASKANAESKSESGAELGESNVKSAPEPGATQEFSVKSEPMAAKEPDKAVMQEGIASVRSSQAIGQILEPEEEKTEASVEPEEEKIEANVEPEEEKIEANVEPEEEKTEVSVEPAEEKIEASIEHEEEKIEASTEPEEEKTEVSEELAEEKTEASEEPEEEKIEASTEPEEEKTESSAESEEEKTEVGVEPEEEKIEVRAEPEEEKIEASAEPEEEKIEASTEPEEEKTESSAEFEEEKTEASAGLTEEKTEVSTELEPEEEKMEASAELEPEEESVEASVEPEEESEEFNVESGSEPGERQEALVKLEPDAAKEPDKAVKQDEIASVPSSQAFGQMPEAAEEKETVAGADSAERTGAAAEMKNAEMTAESDAEPKPEPEIVKMADAAAEEKEDLSGWEESENLAEDEFSVEMDYSEEQKEQIEEFGRIEKMGNVWGEEEIQELLDCDKSRCRLESYDRDILYDIIRGHWELFESGENISDNKEEGLIARDPKLDIRPGVIGIDFGTKSTVVVRQDATNRIIPIRIGTGNLSNEVKEEDFENPSIVEFTNVKKFLEDYRKETGRPHTSCNDVFVSYDAYEDFRNCNPDDFYAYFSELKQWANHEKGNVIIKDKQKAEYTLGGKADEEAKVVNPIELYAYYIGLYINNMRNGIYLKYLMTFPVGYAKEVRDFIADSFYEGIKKSLPAGVINDEECMKQFKVELGISEPAAYAVTALEQSGLEPKDETEHRMYGIFDFGGGTTDFDFGICRGTTEEEYEKEAYDYVLECFGADSDVTLGGENILELMAYQVYQRNLEVFREKKITFMLPLGENGFAGSETLLINSQIARRNMAILKEELRPLWHQAQGWRKKYQLEDDAQKESDKEGIIVSLYNMDGDPVPQCVLEFSSQELVEVLKNRIQKGIDSFFQCLIKIFLDKKELKKQGDTIYIFLAGNSSKSVFVKELFQRKIEEYYARTKTMDEGMWDVRFELIEPLAGESENGDQYVPNAKTGVAYGLLKSREGSSIKIVKNYETDSQQQSRFHYYLGRDHRHCFDCRFSPVEVAYKKWVPFQGASKSVVRIYYTNNPMADSKMEQMRIDNVPYKEISIDVKKDAYLFIRTVEPDVVEYVVAEDVEEIAENEIKKCYFG